MIIRSARAFCGETMTLAHQVAALVTVILRRVHVPAGTDGTSCITLARIIALTVVPFEPNFTVPSTRSLSLLVVHQIVTFPLENIRIRSLGAVLVVTLRVANTRSP